MRRPPKATKVYESANKTVWQIDWPSTMQKWGKTYFATTYPDSEIIFMETAAKRRPVSPLVGRKILPQIKAAISAA